MLSKFEVAVFCSVIKTILLINNFILLFHNKLYVRGKVNHFSVYKTLFINLPFKYIVYIIEHICAYGAMTCAELHGISGFHTKKSEVWPSPTSTQPTHSMSILCHVDVIYTHFTLLLY